MWWFPYLLVWYVSWTAWREIWHLFASVCIRKWQLLDLLLRYTSWWWQHRRRLQAVAKRSQPLLMEEFIYWWVSDSVIALSAQELLSDSQRVWVYATISTCLSVWLSVTFVDYGQTPQRIKLIFTVRNARIASTVLAIAIPSVCLSIRLSVRLSHAGIVSKRRHVARCSLHCRIAKCVWFCRNQKYSPGTTPFPWNLGSNPFPLKSWLQVTYPILIAASWQVLPCSASTVRDRKRSSITLNKNSTRAFQEPSTRVLRRP